MGQGTLAFTNQLLLRVFTCNTFGLHQLTDIPHIIQKNSTPTIEYYK
jgi:hypothetical protein